MKNKVWHMITISTDEQDVLVYPAEEFNRIIIETKEIGDKTQSRSRMYLNEDEMELLIVKMREMMNYVKGGEQ